MKSPAPLALLFVLACTSTTPVPPSNEALAPPAPADAPAQPSGPLAELGYYGEDAAIAASKSAGECPGADDGSELVGRVAPPWQLESWANSEPLELADLRGRVVVLRFWMAGCPYCERSMPALQALSEELAGAPVTFVGAFHAKPESGVTSMDEPLALTQHWGVTFPLARDREWKTLRSWWLGDGHHRHATSVTFVIGKDGRIVHVHPGPEYFPSRDPAHADANRDYQALKAAIVAAAR